MLDRKALVRRHTVVVDRIDPRSPLQVGNGSLACGVDVTGLQTFPEAYPVPDTSGGEPGTLLGTFTQWAWHSTPPPEGGAAWRGGAPELPRRVYRTRRGEVAYVDAEPTGRDDAAMPAHVRWLRANPHRLDLLRLGLILDGTTPSITELGPCRQVLDLWAGRLTSDVTLAGRHLRVTTACHPEADVLAVRIEQVDPPSEGAQLGVRLAFPYGCEAWAGGADWTAPEKHRTQLDAAGNASAVVLSRFFDGADRPLHRVRVAAPDVRRVGQHAVLATGPGSVLDVVVGLAQEEPPGPLPTVTQTLAAAAGYWKRFWTTGAALDLSGSADPRAPELERRAVLSQYLTAIQCSGCLPPQETGLLVNSWRGRFHLEMHYWHAAHFALWGRPELLEPSMEFYREILPVARETARQQGYDGARWPKQVGPDGRESPSHIGPFLLWQQPHVIHLAELLRRAGTPRAVERYGDLVEATARFMADVAEPTPDGFALGPPLVPAQESYAEERHSVTNPPFELASWSWALRVAQQWRQRAGLAPEPRWTEVADGMASPLVAAGRYAAVGTVPDNGASGPLRPRTVRADHPSMVYGLGVVPATGALDPGIVRATLHDVLADWDWPSTWGWDFPALAMTATRLGEPSTAVDLLLSAAAKNTYLPNGHNWQSETLPAYLPGNGGLLTALAMMAGGWDGGPGTAAPGFPSGWSVRAEGFIPAP